MVLLETAIAVPLLCAVACVLAWGLSLVLASVSLSDAARSAARDIARGVDVDQALARASGAVPDAEVTIEGGGDMVTVTARRSVPVPALPGLVIPLQQSVATPREWQ